MPAVGAAHAGEAFLQIAAPQKRGHRLLDDGAPETVLGLIALIVDLLEGVKMLVEQTPQVGGLGIAWAVEKSGLDTSGGHRRKGGWWTEVHKPPHGNKCTLVVEPAPDSLDVTDIRQAAYVTEASVRPRRVSVENLSARTHGRRAQPKLARRILILQQAIRQGWR